jgi:TonB family protein
MQGSSRASGRSVILATVVLAPVLAGCAALPSKHVEERREDRLSRRLDVHYPGIAQRNRWQGTVVLTVVVAADFHLASVEVKAGSGYQVLDDAVVSSVKKLEFTPGDVGTNIVQVAFEIPD